MDLVTGGRRGAVTGVILHRVRPGLAVCMALACLVPDTAGQVEDGDALPEDLRYASRRVVFPAQRSLGKLSARPWTVGGRAHVKRLGPARGEFNIDPGQWVILRVDKRAVQDLSPLAQLPPDAIQELDLHRTPLQDVGLSHLRGLFELRRLDLRETEVGDAGLPSIAKFGDLRRLLLRDTRVTDAGLVHLEPLSQLRVLDLSDTAVTSDGLARLTGLGHLRELRISDTAVDDAGLAHIAELPNLEVLSMRMTLVSGAGLSHIADLASLRRVVLRDSGLDASAMPHLQQMTQLKSIDIRDTKLTIDDARRLSQALPGVAVLFDS